MLTHYLIVETIKFDVFMIDMLISTREVNLIEKSGIVGFIDTKDAWKIKLYYLYFCHF